MWPHRVWQCEEGVDASLLIGEVDGSCRVGAGGRGGGRDGGWAPRSGPASPRTDIGLRGLAHPLYRLLLHGGIVTTTFLTCKPSIPPEWQCRRSVARCRGSFDRR